MSLQNLHTHTTFCDGENTPEEMVLAALDLGMDSLGFSGHAPFSFSDDWVIPAETLPRYRAEILRLRKKYAGRLSIFLGLEQDYFSPPPDAPYDYLIGSVHALRRDGMLYFLDDCEDSFLQTAERCFHGDLYALAEAYYQQVGDVVRQTGCQIVGHFDLICKFNEGDRLFDTAHPRYRAAVLEAVRRLAEEQVVVEINTGAVAKGYRSTPYPAPFLLQAMQKAGIPICISSDAHSAAALLSGFPQAAALARACGYRESMYLTEAGFQAAPLPSV